MAERRKEKEQKTGNKGSLPLLFHLFRADPRSSSSTPVEKKRVLAVDWLVEVYLAALFLAYGLGTQYVLNGTWYSKYDTFSLTVGFVTSTTGLWLELPKLMLLSGVGFIALEFGKEEAL